MKAILVHEKGGPEVLQLGDAATPEPGPNEVRIRVHAAGVNFADHLMRIGAYHADAFPLIPGLEAAGIVDKVGAQVRGIEPGQRVMTWTKQSYAEYVVSPTWAVLAAPRALSFEQAAAIPVVFGTAWHALVPTAGLQSGERVLVHAAGSGVGSAAIQVAKQLGAWVVATAGQDWKLERARELGADAVINYTTQDVAQEIKTLTEGRGVDVVLEGVGKATFAASVASLGENGRLVIYGSPSGPRVELDTRHAIARNLSFFGISIITSSLFPGTVDSFAQTALPWFESGRLHPVVDQVYPLADAADAHRRILERSQFGKLVLRVHQ